MSTTKLKTIEEKIEYISDEIHEFYWGGFYYDVLPEKLRAVLDKQALECYDFQDQCYKGIDNLIKILERIINEQYPVYATVDYYWMEDKIRDSVRNGFQELIFRTCSLCANSKDGQPLSQIYADLGLWNKDSKHPRHQPALLNTLREEVETLSDSEWKQLLAENKVFGLLDYQNNEMRYKSV